jgi:hypothetical protein
VNDQLSVTGQLRDAVTILNREGLHDAADFCRLEVERVDARLKAAEQRERGPRQGDCACCHQRGVQVRPDRQAGETLVCVDDRSCFAAYRALQQRPTESLISAVRSDALKAAEAGLDVAFGRKGASA